VLFGAVCAIEEERFQSSTKSNCWFCSFQFSRQLVPRSRCSSGKCSIHHFPVRPWHDIGLVSAMKKQNYVQIQVTWPKYQNSKIQDDDRHS